MSIYPEKYQSLQKELDHRATLVAVSKTKPAADIQALYDLGQRDFGENYVQELTDKQIQLPQDIRWHFIGHLQSNKVKYIAPFVHLIHGVDSQNLLNEIDKQAAKHHRTIDCLLQVHIAQEETKFGLNGQEIQELIQQYSSCKHVNIRGLMGMASHTENIQQIRKEFQQLKRLYSIFNTQYPIFNILSMGMSGDYRLALEEGSNMVRIGSLLFGERNYSNSEQKK